MIVLALEFSSPHRSVAVCELQMDRTSARLLQQVSDQGARSVKPLELVQQALSGAGVKKEAVQLLALGLGPGSYTGIRSAIALAQG